jgi:hypothetical protein
MLNVSNPLLQLLSALQKQEQNDSYFIILQHSESFTLRQQSAHNDVDVALYQRANVPLPSEIAKRDLTGKLWLLELCQHCTSNLIWVQTGLIKSMRPNKFKAIVVHWSGEIDPFGWETTTNNSNSDQIPISPLLALTEKILKEASLNSLVIMDSINPLLMLYGWEPTFQFLQNLRNKLTGSTIVIPVLIECLTVEQHILLEDMSQALLVLENGVMTMLRQGVRERSKFLRETVPFEWDGTTLRLDLLDLLETERSMTSSTLPKIQSTKLDMNPKTSVAKVGGSINLRHEEEDSHLHSRRTKPIIFLQDNDPEFQDLDEEDPDDDLDF